MKEKVLENRLTRYVKGFLQKYAPSSTVKVTVSNSSEKSYCQEITPGEYFIHIGMRIFEDLPENEVLTAAKGLAAHEIAHAMYTDYQAFQGVAIKTQQAQDNIPLIGEELLKDISNQDKVNELRNAIFDYVYGKNLFHMLNSYEDAAIEHIIASEFPTTYPNLIYIRDKLSEKEQSFFEKTFKEMDTTTYKSGLLELLISELRHMATIAYRKPNWTFNFLSNKGVKKVMHKYSITKENTIDMKYLGLHARLMAKSTKERLADSMVALDYLKEVIDEKVDLFLQQYLTTLIMPNLDDLNINMPGAMSHSELAINVPVSSPISGASNHTSDYDMDIPPSLQNKIDQKTEEMNQENNSKNGQGGQQNQNQKNQSGNSEPENSESRGSNSQSEQTDNEKPESSGSGKEAKDEESNSESESKAEGETSEASSVKNGESEKDWYSEEAEEKMKKQTSEEATKAYESLKNELKKNQKELENAVDKDFKSSVEQNASKSGKAPLLEDSYMGEEAGNIHKGVRVSYTPPEKVSQLRIKGYEGKSAERNKAKHIALAAKFSQKLKKILLYEAHSKIQRGLLQGKLNTSGLYRVKTDSKVFKKKEVGQVKSARFCVLIDESGSMSGEKMTNAIEAAALLASACQRIKVPVSVYGHKTGHGVILTHYIDYKTWKKPNAIDNLYFANSGGSNRDGLALFHSLKYLANNAKSNEHLVMLVISDGAPADSGYYGSPAFADIQSMYMAFEKNYNIKTIGVGIGRDTEHVPSIYKDFLIVPNVESLGDKLLEILTDVLI